MRALRLYAGPSALEHLSERGLRPSDIGVVPAAAGGPKGLILGPMMEEYLRRAMLISRGDWSVFVTRPLSASLLAIAAILLTVVLLPSIKKKREEAFVED